MYAPPVIHAHDFGVKVPPIVWVGHACMGALASPRMAPPKKIGWGLGTRLHGISEQSKISERGEARQGHLYQLWQRRRGEGWFACGTEIILL